MTIKMKHLDKWLTHCTQRRQESKRVRKINERSESIEKKTGELEG